MKVTISKYGYKYWAFWVGGELLAVTLYKRGAEAVGGLRLALAAKRQEGKSLRKSPPNR